MIIYHGTDKQFHALDLSKAKDFRDFGKGYYAFTDKERAHSWAQALEARYCGNEIFLYEYYIDIYARGLKVKKFDSFSEEFLKFLKAGRTTANFSHEYDVVISPATDDKSIKVLSDYTAQIITAADAVKNLALTTTHNQVSLHSNAALKRLVLRRTEHYAR